MSRAPVIATAIAKRTREYEPNMCLRFVRRELFGIDPEYGSAAEAWAHTKYRRPGATPPAGMPTYWTGGSHGFGHIAISAGGGYVYTTDNPMEGRGQVGLCKIGVLTSRWDLDFKGGALDVNDVIVYRWSAIDLSKIQHAAEVDPDLPQGQIGSYPTGTRLVESALYLIGYLPGAYAFDGQYGKATREAYADWQRALGYTGRDADGIPGRASLSALGERYHWTVTP